MYILVKTNIDSLAEIYIGEADPIGNRLLNHYRGKDFWEWGIFFISKDDNLSKAHIKYLEAELYHIAAQLKLCKLHNMNEPKRSNISEAEKADLDHFKKTMITIFPTAGLHCFTPAEQYNEQMIFMIKQPNDHIDAKGYESKQGFVVCEGATIRRDIVGTRTKYIMKHRQQYIDQGIIRLVDNKYRTMQDITFTSPSAAASVVLGRRANGRVNWKNTDGTSLKEIQLNIIREKT